MWRPASLPDAATRRRMDSASAVAGAWPWLIRLDTAGDEHRIEVAGRPRGVIGHRQGGASDEDELGSRPAGRQFRRQVIEERADVLTPEARAHARSSAPLVMKTPRRRNEDGDSTRARGWRPRRSVTNHQGHASRPGSGAQPTPRRPPGPPAPRSAAAAWPPYRPARAPGPARRCESKRRPPRRRPRRRPRPPSCSGSRGPRSPVPGHRPAPPRVAEALLGVVRGPISELSW
jgi:hypothetical protein